MRWLTCSVLLVMLAGCGGSPLPPPPVVPPGGCPDVPNRTRQSAAPLILPVDDVVVPLGEVWYQALNIAPGTYVLELANLPAYGVLNHAVYESGFVPISASASTDEDYTPTARFTFEAQETQFFVKVTLLPLDRTSCATYTLRLRRL